MEERAAHDTPTAEEFEQARRRELARLNIRVSSHRREDVPHARRPRAVEARHAPTTGPGQGYRAAMERELSEVRWR